MTKTELVKSIAEKADMSQTMAAAALDAALESIGDDLSNDGKITLVGFGTFAVSHRAARKGRNPQTGAEIDIAASKSVGFKAGKALKDKVNG